MAITYDDSFDGVAFLILQRDQDEENDAQIAVRIMPGGVNVYVDYAGPMPTVLRYRLLVEDDNTFAALKNKRGTEGTLANPNGFGNLTATLLRLTGRFRHPTGESEVTAEFLLS